MLTENVDILLSGEGKQASITSDRFQHKLSNESRLSKSQECIGNERYELIGKSTCDANLSSKLRLQFVGTGTFNLDKVNQFCKQKSIELHIEISQLSLFLDHRKEWSFKFFFSCRAQIQYKSNRFQRKKILKNRENRSDIE